MQCSNEPSTPKTLKENHSNKRTKEVKKHMFLSLLLKGISMLISFVYVPLTLNYVKAEEYGIWLTLFSSVTIILYFDLGITHGFRNRFAEAIAKGKLLLARQYLSTTYITLALIFLPILGVTCLVNTFLNWNSILNLPTTYQGNLNTVVYIVLIGTIIKLIADPIGLMLTALQQTAYHNLIITIGQAITLLTIVILIHTTESNLIYLAVLFTIIPCLVTILSTFVIFALPAYSKYKPSLRLFRKDLIKDILSLGGKFFMITSCMLVIFQFINFIIIRYLGSDMVMNYNIAYKYFNLLSVVLVIVITPFWSAFTDAYTLGDFNWMKKSLRKLEQIWLLVIFVQLAMLGIAPYFYHYWLHNDQIVIPFSLNLLIFFYTLCSNFGQLYMYPINGIGKIQMQLIVYVVSSLVAIPLMIFGVKHWGIYGVIVVPTLVYLAQAIVGKIQIEKIMNKKATGLWNK